MLSQPHAFSTDPIRNKQYLKIMKLIQVIALAAAACGVMVSASCCSKTADSAPATYVAPAK